MLRREEIIEAKHKIGLEDKKNYEHDDCIRIAYEWLDAQKKIKSITRKSHPLKHYIERWGGRYVSKDDVVVAAYIHPDIFGVYPKFNIDSRLVEPSRERLKNVSMANTQNQREEYEISVYAIVE